MSTWIVVGFLFFKNDVKYEYRDTYDDINDAFMYHRVYISELYENLSDQPNFEPGQVKSNPEILMDNQLPYYEYKFPENTTDKNFFVITKNECSDYQNYPEEPEFSEVICVIRLSELEKYCTFLDEPSVEKCPELNNPIIE